MNLPRIRKEVSKNPGRCLDEPQPPKRRALRPGQSCPRKQTNEEDDRAGSEGSDEELEQRTRSRPHLPQKERQERSNEAWKARSSGDVEAFTMAAPALAAQQAARRAAELAALQGSLNSAVPYHRCSMQESSGGSSSGNGSQFTPAGVRRAAYHGPLGTVGYVDMPLHRCSLCQSEVTAHPLQVGCLPTDAVINTTLISIDVAQQYVLQQQRSGISGHGECFVDALLVRRLARCPPLSACMAAAKRIAQEGSFWSCCLSAALPQCCCCTCV